MIGGIILSFETQLIVSDCFRYSPASRETLNFNFFKLQVSKSLKKGSNKQPIFLMIDLKVLT